MKRKLNYFSTIQFLFRYIKRHGKNFIMFYFGWFFDTVLAVVIPILSGIMIDEIIYYQNLETFVKVSMTFVVLLFFSCILYFFIYAQHHYLMNMYTLDIKKDLFEHFQQCDAQYLSGESMGDITVMLQNYSQECMHFVIRNVIHFFNGVLRIVVIAMYLFQINWQIGIFILMAAPVSVTISTAFGKKIRTYGDKQRKYYGSYISWVFECLRGICDIRMLGAVSKVERDFTENHKKMFSVNIKSGLSSLTAANMVKLTNLATQLAIFAFAGYMAKSGDITMGALLVIVTFFSQLTFQIGTCSNSFLDAQTRVSYVQRVYDFINSPTEKDWEGMADLQITEGRILLKNIKFSYDNGEAVLNDFNVEIPPGKRFALIGKSGCGKSTLAYMLLGFYRPQEGEIWIDGQMLSQCSLRSIRKNIGLIAQDVLIFDGSIKENVLLGNKKASDDEVISACRQSGLGSFIENLPKGVDTIVGTKGVGLSGGQKQRIAIARIYLKNPKIIIFDEATSALDSETEEVVHEAWKAVLAGRTCIMIAHRQSSVMLCDHAAILEEGKICEMGIPEKMAAESKAFRRLFVMNKEDPND